MKQGSPASLGFPEDGAPLPAQGRAERRSGGAGRELWRFSIADEPAARRLLLLGEANVGGFVDGVTDGGSVWLARRTSGTSLHELFRSRKGPWPWREALAIGRALAVALAACDKAALFPGPLAPAGVMVDGSAAVLLAPGLVAALAGAAEGASRSGGTVAPLWIPPAQADGAPWDAAANRYALGLVLYRMLSGEHPFAGAGLRHALEAANREAPPFREVVAKELPAGLQSFCLRMIGGEGEGRAKSAAEVVTELDRFVADLTPPAPLSLPRPVDRGRVKPGVPRQREGGGEQRPVRLPPLSGTAPQAATPGRTLGRARERGAGGVRFVHYWPLAAGVVVALASLAAVLASPARPADRTLASAAVAPSPPLAEAHTSAADCAACHPRQAAEWRRSVMAHAVKSPLFNALESLIEEQVGRDEGCPGGAGILRKANGATACRDAQSGAPVTGSGGEHWCVNCHSPTEKLDVALPPWEGRASGDPRTRRPVRDLLGERGLEGVSCGFCHQVHGPVPARGAARGGYEGNATWTSFVTGATFAARPEDGRGLTGIGNSGYDLRPDDFLLGRGGPAPGAASVGVHLRPPRAARSYLASSEFCGSCHDVRLFGTDTLGAAHGEHFKRLRNAYSEWVAWGSGEARAGRPVSTCQDCHLSEYPGVCEADPGASGADPECPQGYRFSPRAAGAWPQGRAATSSAELSSVVTHYFSGVDVPLSRELPQELVDEPTVDLHGVPLSARRRRDILLRHTFRFGLGAARRGGQGLEIPVEIENVGAGHRVPAGFSQEREIWVHLAVRDGDGRLLYEVGRVDRADEDLRDKLFLRVNVRGDELDARGRPLGLFGADVRDGPDVPQWQPPPVLGGTSFRGRGLVNFQNGFLRCVRCLGTVGADGRCEAGSGQGDTRAARFADGDYDLDTGACRSNLVGANALFETYFPVGALDAGRGLVKGPDAIVDTRSVPPRVPIRYVYELATAGRRGPFRVEARLLFRAFPPFLIKGFAAYEREQARRGLRPSGPLVSEDMLGRLEVVEIGKAEAQIP